MDSTLALFVLYSAMRVEKKLSALVAVRMIANIAFDFIIGIIPIVGNLADATFRVNIRNATLLELHLLNSKHQFHINPRRIHMLSQRYLN